jgi:hypothetical protein
VDAHLTGYVHMLESFYLALLSVVAGLAAALTVAGPATMVGGMWPSALATPIILAAHVPRDRRGSQASGPSASTTARSIAFSTSRTSPATRAA